MTEATPVSQSVVYPRQSLVYKAKLAHHAETPEPYYNEAMIHTCTWWVWEQCRIAPPIHKLGKSYLISWQGAKCKMSITNFEKTWHLPCAFIHHTTFWNRPVNKARGGIHVYTLININLLPELVPAAVWSRPSSDYRVRGVPFLHPRQSHGSRRSSVLPQLCCSQSCVRWDQPGLHWCSADGRHDLARLHLQFETCNMFIDNILSNR